MAAPLEVSIRPMTTADIPAGLALCRASRWNQTDRDWRHFLAAAPRGALVAVERGVVIGTVATLPYGPFAWIAMVLVEPAARGRGVGTLLLERGLDLVPPGSAARLDATPAGEVFYRKLGFAGEYGLARWFSDARTTTPAPQTTDVAPLEGSDWPAMLEMDVRAFGASRATLLERLASDAPEYAWAVRRDGRLDGYLLGRHGHVREQLGPLVARSAASGVRLLEACLAAHPGRAFFIDVPDGQHALRDRLAQLGFAIERPFLRMYRGALTAPGQPSQVFAITGPEFG
ncbi:MAG TPA: GNAT family N-acetyltransferase [Vicinamibacterales bacterium]|nr:GNAT family N-acetyltransferase [Vicinamibacterales bacterium]